MPTSPGTAPGTTPGATAGAELRWRGLTVTGRTALFGVLLALPGAIVLATGHVKPGIVLLLSMLPAAIIGIAPQRKRRRVLLIVGAGLAVSLMLGAVLAQWPPVAIAVMTLVALFAPQLARGRLQALGALTMTLCLPLIGIGFSLDADDALGFGVLIMIGTVLAFAISMCFPARTPPAGAAGTAAPAMSAAQARGYGITLAATALISSILGFALPVDHPGWVVGAALLVMRPRAQVRNSRIVGRVVAVLIGVLVAGIVVTVDSPDWVYAILAPLALILLAATSASSWYITAGYTSFLVLVLITYGDADSLGHFAGERVGETLVGVAVAFVCGELVPAVLRRRATRLA